MDREGFKSLLWIVVWGGLFFVMMRRGCGAHIGGHRHSGHRKREAPDGEFVKDPVCGMTVSPQQAKAASVHRGTTYYFCSASCRDKFEQAPEKYLGAGAQAAPQHEGHHG
jgi:YHS domain-containing protein